MTCAQGVAKKGAIDSECPLLEQNSCARGAVKKRAIDRRAFASKLVKYRKIFRMISFNLKQKMSTHFNVRQMQDQ